MKPPEQRDPFIERRRAREKVTLSASVEADGVLGWAVLVSACELPINVVIRSKPKALLGLSQNGTQSDAPFDTRCTRINMTAGEKAEPNPLLSFAWNTVSPIVRPRQNFGYGRRPAREAVGQVGMRTRKKRTTACNGSHRGSKFALTRKGADFRVVQLS